MHLEEDFGEDGLEVEQPLCVPRSVCAVLYTDDKDIASRWNEGFAEMMSVTVTVYEEAGLTIPEMRPETMLLRAPNQVLPTPPLIVEAGSGGICRRSISVHHEGSYRRKPRLYSRNILTDLTCVGMNDRFKREQCDMEDASFTLKVRLL